MTTENWLYRSWAYARSPECVKTTESGTSATYQATGAYVGKLHVFISGLDTKIEGGSGSSVTATSKLYLKAGTPYYFRPETGRESLGYASADGSTAFSAALPATVANLEKTSQ